MAALTAVPMSNVFKNAIKDYVVTVGGTTIAGQAMTYIQGGVLKNKGYEKQGEMYKKMATDPTMIALNLSIGSAFWALGRARRDPNVTQDQLHQIEAEAQATIDNAIKDADLQSSPTELKTMSDTFQHEANINTVIDQVMKGEKVKIKQATGGTPKQPTAQFDIKAPIHSNQSQRVKDSYQAAQVAGFSPSQARALVGELGRENGFNPDTMFGSHQDQANHKTNRGIFSWQDAVVGKGRLTNLMNHMQAKGLVNVDGTFKRTNESLTAQFEFLRKEIESNPKWKKSFLDKKNISNDEARAALGGKGTIIGWARGQTKLKSGANFDWQAHEATANKYSNMVDGEPTSTIRAEDGIEITDTAAVSRDLSALDDTIHRADLKETVLGIKVDLLDMETLFPTQSKPKSAKDDTTGMFDFTDVHFDMPTAIKQTEPHLNTDAHADLFKMIEEVTKEAEITPIPHTAEGVRVKNGEKEFKPDDSIKVEWNESIRYENKKAHKELSRTHTDEHGNTIQELKYRGTYASRTVDSAGKTNFIHVGRSNKSDFKNHAGNKELETAFNRIFNTNNYGYLSQVPKGMDTIARLEADPSKTIASKRTGEEFTASQWKQKLQNEQDNIITMKKAMQTLATCALKKAS